MKKTTETNKPVIYGYARVSTSRQNLSRQIANILAVYPDAQIRSEKFTGTTINRPVWTSLFNALKSGDVVIFDEVSRMSRSADEGAEIYETLYRRGVNLIFLKQPLVNTDNYRKTAEMSLAMTGNEIADIYINATNQALMALARMQVKQAFEQAEQEVSHLHRRVSEGMRASGASGKLNETQDDPTKGKIAKARAGKTFETKRSKEAKVRILQMSKDFNGSMPDKDVIAVLGLARNSYYKYKAELKQSQQQPTT